MSKIVPPPLTCFEIYVKNNNFVKDLHIYSDTLQTIFCVTGRDNTAGDHDLQLKMWFIPREAKWHKTVTGKGQGTATGQNTKGLALALLRSSANLGKHLYSLILILLNYNLALH